MVVGELVRAELRRVDWASLKCGCGDSAEHVPLLFEAIITAEAPRDMIGYTLDDHVEGGTVIFECTPPAVGVIMASLAGDLSTPARDVLLQTLLFVAAVPATMNWMQKARVWATHGHCGRRRNGRRYL
ncbi:hypothetical protein [Streptomyces sp. NPDC001903]|uniref:hypothetical protein n=1 Tax=Streptomyces sp. NPDC001903 TaxID=3364622 RepID=UPI0036C974DA